MRQYVIGALVGAALTLSFNATAAVESLIGKQIQGEAPVVLNDQPLDTTGAILDGTTYVPVRAISEALGLDVDFKDGTVVLDKENEEAPTVSDPVTPEVPATPEPEAEATSVNPADLPIRTADDVKNDISNLKAGIWAVKASIESSRPDDQRLPIFQERLIKYEQELADLEKELAALQTQTP